MRIACAVLLGVFWFAQPAAADKYVRQGASGTASGVDWTNACTDFTGSCADSAFTRGETIWVADGSYGTETFDTATSGTSLITIQKATASAHGTDTGWVSTYGDGQATFGEITFDSDYWVFDGATRDSADWADGAAYGFAVTPTIHVYTDATTRCGDHITVQYVHIDANTNADAFKSNCFTGSAATDLTVRRSYLHDAQEFATAHMTVVNGCLFEENFFGQSTTKEAIRGQSEFRNCVIRRNIFKDACGEHAPEACTADIAIWDGSSGSFDNNEIYGNVFWDTNGEGSTSSVVILVGGNGGSWAGSPASGTLVFNNTIVGFTDTSPNILVNGGSGNICRNNLFYNNVGSPSVTCGTASNNGSGDEVSDPFVDSSGGDFHLSGASSGVSTDSPSGNATDIDGCARGDDGVFDRGAFEYNVSACEGPAAPETVPLLFRLRMRL